MNVNKALHNLRMKYSHRGEDFGASPKAYAKRETRRSRRRLDKALSKEVY